MNNTANELHDIYETWHVPFWQTTLFYTIMGVVATFMILVLIILLVRWYKRRTRKPLTPWQHALMAFKQLHPEAISSKQDAKKFYGELTQILKKYIQERYEVPATSKTDTEFIAHVERASLVPFDLIDGLKELIHGALHVKFADMSAVQEQMKTHVRLCIASVEKTIPEK